jgi:CRP/FNR family transcriptional regulator, cyclic AMP receptor protein
MAVAFHETHAVTMSNIVAKSGFFKGMRADHLEYVASCGRRYHFSAGQAILMQGQLAERFYILQSGTVVLQACRAGAGAVPVQRLSPGDALGWSWVFPPYRWHLDAVALAPVDAVGFSAAGLRTKCARDHEFGSQMMHRFGQLMMQRLEATQGHLLDAHLTGSSTSTLRPAPSSRN